MSSSTFLFALLLAIIQGWISACSNSNCEHRIDLFREKIIAGMGMSQAEIQGISSETVDEARKITPVLSTHQRVDNDHLFLLEQDFPLDPSEHLFFFSSITHREVQAAYLSFFIRPVFPPRRLTFDVKTRAPGSDTLRHVKTVVLNSPRQVKKYRMNLEADLARSWFDSHSQSIIISIECREVDSDVIVHKDDDDSSGKRMMIELEMSRQVTRRRRSFEEKKECKMDEKGEILPGQECCVATRMVDLSKISNIVSPTMVSLSWCAGECRKESSFKTLFDKITTKVFDDGSNGARCCHAVESQDIDVLYLDKANEIKNERLFDASAVKCACA